MSLQRALDALATNPRLALDELLLSWKASASPEVAALIDALDARFTAALPAVTEDAAWRAVERKKESADIGRLSAATQIQQFGSWRLDLLSKRPPDPRLAQHVLKLISPETLPMNWYTYLRMLKRSPDPRVAPGLEQVVAKWPKQAPMPESWKNAPESHRARQQQEHEALKAQVAELAAKLKKGGKSVPDAQLIPKVRAAIGLATGLGGVPAAAKKAKKEQQALPELSGGLVEKLLDEAAAASAPESMLPPLLKAWSAQRGPELAALIEETGARIGREALPLKPEVEAVSAWRDVEKQRDPADLDRLIAAVASVKVDEIIFRLETLAQWPPDPRLSRLASKLLEQQPFRSKGARKLYNPVNALLEAMSDPRSAAMVQHLEKNFMPGAGVEGGTDFQNFFASLIARASKAAAKVPPAGPLSAEAKEKLEALGKRSSAGAAGKKEDGEVEQKLLAQIWARPDDDQPRLVYADFLSERSRPHGEFIALQISNTNPKRQKELQKKHAKELLGPLAAAFNVGELVFERGFVRHGVIVDKVSPQLAALETHPAWTTLKSCFAWSHRRNYPALVAHLKKLGVKVCENRPAFLASLPKKD